MSNISRISEDAVKKSEMAVEATDEAASDAQALYQLMMRLVSVLEAVNRDFNEGSMDESRLKKIHSELGAAEEIEEKIETIHARLKDDIEFVAKDFKKFIKPELIELEEDLEEASNDEDNDDLGGEKERVESGKPAAD